MIDGIENLKNEGMIFGEKSMELENWGIRSNEEKEKKMIEGKSEIFEEE